MSRRQTTGAGLDADAAFVGLVDFALFAEKVPPCFTSEGLAAGVPSSLAKVARETDLAKLAKLISKQSRGFMRYQTLRDINIPRHLLSTIRTPCYVSFWDKNQVPTNISLEQLTQTSAAYRANEQADGHDVQLRSRSWPSCPLPLGIIHELAKKHRPDPVIIAQ